MRPKLREAFIPISFNKPSSFKCSLVFIKSKAFLNKIYSVTLTDISGYCSKCFITICNSLGEKILP